MKKRIFFVFCICAFFSCANQPEIITEEETPDNYVFKNIEYTIQPDKDGIETIEFSKVVLQYENGTSLRQMIPLDFLEGIKNSFYFQNEDINTHYTLTGDSVKVPIPENISSDYQIVLSQTKWLYSNRITQFSPAINAYDTLYVEPSQNVKVECTYIMDKYTVSYVVTFITQTGRQELTIPGKWTGNFLREIQPRCTFEKL